MIDFPIKVTQSKDFVWHHLLFVALFPSLARYLLFLFIEVAQRNVYHLKRNNGDIIRILLADEKVWVVDDLAFVSTVTHSHKLRSQTKAHDTLLTLSLSLHRRTHKSVRRHALTHTLKHNIISFSSIKSHYYFNYDGVNNIKMMLHFVYLPVRLALFMLPLLSALLLLLLMSMLMRRY